MPNPVRPQRVQLRRDPTAGIVGVEGGPVTKVLSGGAQLEEGKHLVVRKPRIPEVGPRAILGAAKTDARALHVQVDRSGALE